MRPRLLDLCCAEGGGSVGFQRAGFAVYGVDLFRHRDAKGRLVGHDRSRYPFPALQMDALLALQLLLTGHSLPFHHLDGHLQHLRLTDFAVIAASFPCQRFTHGNAGKQTDHVDLITPGRPLLQATGLPWVMENVPRAPLIDPTVLCWSMFHEPGSVLDTDGTPLTMLRHRAFESPVDLTPPGPCRHPRGVQIAGAYGGARRDKVEARQVRKGGYVPASQDVLRRLLRIDWMTEAGMFQSLPPVYTEHLGRQLLATL